MPAQKLNETRLRQESLVKNVRRSRDGDDVVAKGAHPCYTELRGGDVFLGCKCFDALDDGFIRFDVLRKVGLSMLAQVVVNSCGLHRAGSDRGSCGSPSLKMTNNASGILTYLPGNKRLTREIVDTSKFLGEVSMPKRSDGILGAEAPANECGAHEYAAMATPSSFDVLMTEDMFEQVH